MPKHQEINLDFVDKKSSNSEALSFISAGVACYAFSLIDDLGLLDLLYVEGKLPVVHLLSYPNPLVLQTAFLTLQQSGIITTNKKFFSLTDFGQSVFRHRASIGYIYKGYRNLLSNQSKIVKDEPCQNDHLIDCLSVAKASVHFGKNIIDEMILNVVRDKSIIGEICDLGCGAATRLIYLCRNTGLKGYGFDIGKNSLKKARENIKKTDRISVHLRDITKIDKIYPNVEVLLQAFVMHDLPDDLCQKTIFSFRSNFPNTKLLIYIDAVTSEDVMEDQLPGFEYIHSLLNIKLRTKKKTLKIFKNTGFNVIEEFEIADLPNCYMWILTPEIQM